MDMEGRERPRTEGEPSFHQQGVGGASGGVHDGEPQPDGGSNQRGAQGKGEGRKPDLWNVTFTVYPANGNPYTVYRHTERDPEGLLPEIEQFYGRISHLKFKPVYL